MFPGNSYGICAESKYVIGRFIPTLSGFGIDPYTYARDPFYHALVLSGKQSCAAWSLTHFQLAVEWGYDPQRCFRDLIEEGFFPVIRECAQWAVEYAIPLITWKTAVPGVLGSEHGVAEEKIRILFDAMVFAESFGTDTME